MLKMTLLVLFLNWILPSILHLITLGLDVFVVFAASFITHSYVCVINHFGAFWCIQPVKFYSRSPFKGSGLTWSDLWKL